MHTLGEVSLSAVKMCQERQVTYDLQAAHQQAVIEGCGCGAKPVQR